MLYLAQLKGLSKPEAIKRIKHWFEKMDMQAWWEKKVEDLSKGMQQKVQFVATVVHQPELLILDEPFTGFDPINTELIKKEILNLNKSGTTIIFSTHRMESVEELCDHIVLLNKAKKIIDGKVAEIKNTYRNNTFTISYIGSQNREILPSENLYTLIKRRHLDGQTIDTLQVLEPYSINDVLSYLIPQVQITALREVIPSINDIFIQQVNNMNTLRHE